MGFAKEFREFAVKGNVIDLAVGVIIGAAFSKIVESIVGDLIMPLIGLFFKADFTNLYIPLSDKVPKGLSLEKAKELGPVFAWGNFVTVLINFIILAFVIFWLVKGINTIRRKEEAAAPPPPPPAAHASTFSEKLLEEIRDALASKNS